MSVTGSLTGADLDGCYRNITPCLAHSRRTKEAQPVAGKRTRKEIVALEFPKGKPEFAGEASITQDSGVRSILCRKKFHIYPPFFLSLARPMLYAHGNTLTLRDMPDGRTRLGLSNSRRTVGSCT